MAKKIIYQYKNNIIVDLTINKQKLTLNNFNACQSNSLKLKIHDENKN